MQMAVIHQKLLDMLVCPVSKVPLVLLSAKQLSALNTHIANGSVQNVDGQAVTGAVQSGLIGTDAKIVYRIVDAIPNLLPEEGIGTTQLLDFPAR
jgi:uncharacterized protein